jgi:hypothetical protein
MRAWWVALVVATICLGGPAAPDAGAQQNFASAVLYEVREGINCNPGASQDPACAPDAPGFGVRIADATLLGGVSNIPGGISGEINGGITMAANSILSQVDWTGPVHGKFAASDGTRVIFAGQLNLSSAILGKPPRPLAPVSGQWQTTFGPVRAGGTFAGLFMIPFACPPGVLSPTGACYLLPTGAFQAVQPNETLGGVPLVRLVFAMTAHK